MAAIKFQNFLAASRKPNLKAFSFAPPEADLSFIESYPIPPTTVNLSGDITGDSPVFTLGVENPIDVEVIWNGVTLCEDVGYTLDSPSGIITMASGYEPRAGDTLVARIYGGI